MPWSKYTVAFFLAAGPLLWSACASPIQHEPAATSQPATSTATVAAATSTHAIPSQSATITPAPTLTACPGKRLAYVKYPYYDVYVACAETGSMEVAFGAQQFQYEIVDMSISPDGNSLLFDSSGNAVRLDLVNEIIAFNLADRTFKTIFSSNSGEIVEDPQWSPNGEFIGYIWHPAADHQLDTSDHLEFLHISTQTLSEIDSPFSALVNMLQFRWSSDGRHIKYMTLGHTNPYANAILFQDISCDSHVGKCTGSKTQSLTHVGGEASLSSDGSLAVGYAEDAEHPRGYLRINNLINQSVRTIALHDLDPDLGFVSEPVFSPDSTHVAFVARKLSTDVTNIYILDLKTMALMNLTHSPRGSNYGNLTW